MTHRSLIVYSLLPLLLCANLYGETVAIEHATPGIIDTHSHMGVYPWPEVEANSGEAPRGLKMALGENPKRNYGARNQSPATRMGNMYLIRDAFIKTREYRAAWEPYNSKKDGAPPARNLNWETLSDVLDGKILVHDHCYRADEMVHMIQVADEFKFKIRSFQHSLEVYKVADLLAEKGVGVATWADWWGFKVEEWKGIPWNAAYLISRGVSVSMHSDSSNTVQRLNVEAEKTFKSGMSESDALKMLTLFPAQILGVDRYIGTLRQEAGSKQ